MKTEDRVAARLDADKNTAGKASVAANAARGKARAAYDKATAKLSAAVDADTLAKRAKAIEAQRVQAKALTAFLRADALADLAHERVVTLDDPKELDRRLKAAKRVDAKRKGDKDQPLAGPDAAEVVLLQAGHPMHYTEITRVALETGVVKLSGKTPAATMNAYLARASKDGDRFVRVQAGVFDLASRVAKAEQTSEVSEPAEA